MQQNMTLHEIQQAFYRAIFEPGAEENSVLYGSINAMGELNGEQLIDIYRNSILGGLTEALSNIYPVCLKLVGEKFFNHMVADYLRRYPSSSPDLGDYGEAFASYIADFTPAKELVYLPDVAALEWCWHRTFNAAEANRADVRPLAELAEIADTDQGGIQFMLSPSAFLLRSAYPVHRIWQINQSDYSGDETVDLDEGQVFLLVWRNSDFTMQIDLLSDEEYNFLTAVKEGKLFAEIAALPCAHLLSEILGRCMQTGWLLGFRLDTCK